MDYLALCRRVAREAGVGGAQSGKPDNVSGNPHRMQVVCDFVSEAANEIEGMYLDWTFLNQSVDFFVEGGSEFLDTRLTQPDILSFNDFGVYARSENHQRRLKKIDWQVIRDYREGVGETLPTKELPSYFSVSPSGQMEFWPVSSDAFVVRAECVVTPKVMKENTDKPNIPESHHDVIITRALMRYYESDEAFDLMQATGGRFSERLGQLRASYLPNMSYSRTASPQGPLTVMVD